MTIDLKLNSRYKFRVIRKILLDDNEEYLVLEDPLKTKHLLPLKYYKNYNLEDKSEIVCYVDKINCKGKVFIDPEHPFYKIGTTYSFPFVRRDKRTTKEGKTIDVLVVKDIYERECTVLPHNYQKDGRYLPTEINCTVERIKKSRLYLVNAELAQT